MLSSISRPSSARSSILLSNVRTIFFAGKFCNTLKLALYLLQQTCAYTTTNLCICQLDWQHFVIQKSHVDVPTTEWEITCTNYFSCGIISLVTSSLNESAQLY